MKSHAILRYMAGFSCLHHFRLDQDLCLKLTVQLLLQMQACTARHTASQLLEDGGSWKTMLSGLGPAAWSVPPWRADEWS